MHFRYVFSLFVVAALSAMAASLQPAMAASHCDGPPTEVLAKIDNDVCITKSELEPVLKEYRKKSGKEVVTREEKINLVKNLVLRNLILRQKSMETLRNDFQIKQAVKHYEDALLVKRYLEDHVGNQVKANSTEIKEYYEKHRDEFSTPPMVAARNILLRSRDHAEKVLARLRKGEDFAKLAKEYSIDLPKAEEGGKMGVIEKGKAVPEIDKVLFSLKPGEVSNIIKTRYGYNILKVDTKYPPRIKPFEQVEGEIKKKILAQKNRKLGSATDGADKRRAHSLGFWDDERGIS